VPLVNAIEVEQVPSAADARDYLQACRRVLAADVLARDRAEVLAIDPRRWPAEAMALRERIAATVLPGTPEAELAMLDLGQDLAPALAECLEQVLGRDAPLAAALLQLQLDSARVCFVYEETDMRLREDPLRFIHAEAHGRLLQRLVDAKVLLRAGRFDDARVVVSAFRADVREHEVFMDSEAGRRPGGES
jgi:hypothetical protein